MPEAKTYTLEENVRALNRCLAAPMSLVEEFERERRTLRYKARLLFSYWRDLMLDFIRL